MNKSLFAKARADFHRRLVKDGILSLDENGVASNADSGNAPSREVAARIARELGAVRRGKQKGQSSGAGFEDAVCGFIRGTFPELQNIRPGAWNVIRLGNRSKVKTASFAQYEHLFYLAQAIQRDPGLLAALGNDYLVAPDVIVSRELCEDSEINSDAFVVDDNVARKSDLRKKNGGKPLLHASISAKWTMRSDRAQNSRTEALNLMRDRKGRLPHIVVVTGEPLPSRIASLALGTGDIDCVYHFALYELEKAVREYGCEERQDIVEQLEAMIAGKRLKDISDLPLDLCC